MANVFDPDYLLAHDLVFIGSPQTVSAKIRAAAKAGVFDTFFGEFNFADLPEPDLLRSIRLFGEAGDPGAARVRAVLTGWRRGDARAAIVAYRKQRIFD